MVYALCFWILATLTVGSACVVAFSKNIVRSAFSLLLTFWGVAGLYALCGADFLAAAQVLIYVGGILVLILFAVMLTHKISEFKLSNDASYTPISFLAFLSVLLILTFVVTYAVDWPELGQVNPQPTSGPIGQALMREYLLPFEIVSVLLLAALIGAAFLARKEVRPQPPADAGTAGAK